MVDINVLTKHGVTCARLKQLFTATKGKDFDSATKIRNRIRNRVQSGITRNLDDFRYWWACDLAWDTSFRQSSQTLIRGLNDRNVSTKEVLNILSSTEVRDMLVLYDKSGKIISGNLDNNTAVEAKVHAPTFFNVFIPLCKAYTTIRAAAIVNQFRQVPTFKYEPAKSTNANRLKCEVVTDRVELMSTQYGYYDVIRQCVMQMLHYSVCIAFPVEEWDSEEQIIINEKGKEEVAVVKEGLRFHMPHPSRTFIDTNWRASTINSDTGVCFGGYWRITRFSDVFGNADYWNKDKVTYGNRDWIKDNPSFFNTVYSTCAVKYKTPTDGDSRDRESRNQYYTADYADSAVSVTEYFELIKNPKEEGIGDYPHPVWFRYVVAAEDTILYAAPLPQNPMCYFGYDALETRSNNPSMTLEILPFQDHISNLFSQYLLTIKQNLANVTFVDTNQVDKKTIDEIANLGQKWYTGLNMVEYDRKEMRMGQNKSNEAFESFTFPRGDTSPLLIGVTQLLNVLERILVISPQELAQTASHELTAEEVKNMNSAKSTRFEFSMGAVDRGIWAMKNLIYAGLMSYGEEEVYARMAQPVDKTALEAMGFTTEDGAETNDHRYVYVTGKKTALRLEAFAANRDADLRINNQAAAQAMVQMLTTVLSNPMLFEELGSEQIIKFLNEISQIAGLPRDFRFTPTGKSQAQQMEMMKQQLAQIAQGIEASAVEAVGKQIVPVLEQQAGQLQQVAQATGQQAGQIQQVAQATGQQANQLQQLAQLAAQLAQQVEQLGAQHVSMMQPQPPYGPNTQAPVVVGPGGPDQGMVGPAPGGPPTFIP